MNVIECPFVIFRVNILISLGFRFLTGKILVLLIYRYILRERGVLTVCAHSARQKEYRDE